jgi:CcmD family protein
MEEVPNTFSWMFYGYLAMWTIFVGYLFSLLRRQRSVEKRLDDRDRAKELG